MEEWGSEVVWKSGESEVVWKSGGVRWCGRVGE